MHRSSSHTGIKVGVVVVVLTALGLLFIRSVRSTRAEPYTIARARLSEWTLKITPASSPNDPILVLEPPPELASALFRQIFARAMESLNAPVALMTQRARIEVD